MKNRRAIIIFYRLESPKSNTDSYFDVKIHSITKDILNVKEFILHVKLSFYRGQNVSSYL